MATISGNNNKYSLRYVASSGQESGTRTISGLNAGGGSNTQTGPFAQSGVTMFLNHFVNFTSGEIGNVRWITEQEVVL